MKKIITVFCGLLLFTLSSFNKKQSRNANIYAPISTYLKAVEKDFNKISDERKAALDKVAVYIKQKLKTENKASLVFICTHNSRRSQMAQLWSNAAANFYGIVGVENFSGGTEMTAFNDRAVKALRNAGFVITKKTEETNSAYEVKFSDDNASIICFSKKYKDAPNPTSNFAAIMTCSSADKNCPIVSGSTARIAIPYEDPKEADGKPNEEAVYNERCRQIATEMMYIFSQVRKIK
jgi:protein-tyrosine-phosphatase